jgi:hypothetical protein
MPSNLGTSSLAFYAVAIDPVWLHIPKYALVRDLGYPIPVAVAGH